MRASDVDAIQKSLIELGFSDTRTLPRARKKVTLGISTLARSLVRLARQYRRPEDEQKLREFARAEIDRLPAPRQKGENAPYILSEILLEDYIGLGTQVADWKEAVRAGGELLCKSGAIDPPYIEAAIQNVVLTRFKNIFLTGQHNLYLAAMLTIMFKYFGLSDTMTVIFGAILLGLGAAIYPAIAQPYMRKITGGNEIAMVHYCTIAYALSG